jgi:geranylgeranyl diphosphate synthase type II
MYSQAEIDGIVQKSLINNNLQGEPAELYDPLEYMVAIGGKRVRPRLCLTVYNLFSDKVGSDVIYPAVALELFHSFTLIHDDIMDKADLRRNHPTVCKKWGNNTAILAGDVMFIKSYQLIAACDPSKLPALLQLFSGTAAKVCEGQQLDLNYESSPFITTDDYLNMIGLKTAVLIACSAKMGAILAGVKPSLADALYNYGYELGIAFQITDDYLDCFGDVNSFGKKIGGDIMENKKSWLLVESLRTSDPALRERLKVSMGITDPEEKIAAVQQFYEDAGIRSRAEKAIDYYYKAGLSILDSVAGTIDETADSGSVSTLDEYQRTRLADFAKSITYRTR